MMSLYVDDIEMFDFTAQVSRIAKSPHNIFLPLADQHTTKKDPEKIQRVLRTDKWSTCVGVLLLMCTERRRNHCREFL